MSQNTSVEYEDVLAARSSPSYQSQSAKPRLNGTPPARPKFHHLPQSEPGSNRENAITIESDSDNDVYSPTPSRPRTSNARDRAGFHKREDQQNVENMAKFRTANLSVPRGHN